MKTSKYNLKKAENNITIKANLVAEFFGFINIDYLALQFMDNNPEKSIDEFIDYNFNLIKKIKEQQEILGL